MAHQADCQGHRLAAAWACEVKASDEANDLLVARHGWIGIEPGQATSSMHRKLHYPCDSPLPE